MSKMFTSIFSVIIVGCILSMMACALTHSEVRADPSLSISTNTHVQVAWQMRCPKFSRLPINAILYFRR